MTALRVETTITADGELHLKDLPVRRGDKVEAIVIVLGQSNQPASVADADEARASAVAAFLAQAQSSSFRSEGPYPARHELHERD